ncbi:MAG: hypothetical protein V4454_14125 [Pseudomonadota bacterium]
MLLGAGSQVTLDTGEGGGDEGSLAQLELRYSAGAFAPFVFWDVGRIKTNVNPAAGATNNKRSLSGAGLGLRYQRNAWSADVVMAWRSNMGGVPQADVNDPKPKVWLNLSYRL